MRAVAHEIGLLKVLQSGQKGGIGVGLGAEEGGEEFNQTLNCADIF